MMTDRSGRAPICLLDLIESEPGTDARHEARYSPHKYIFSQTYRRFFLSNNIRGDLVEKLIGGLLARNSENPDGFMRGDKLHIFVRAMDITKPYERGTGNTAPAASPIVQKLLNAKMHALLGQIKIYCRWNRPSNYFLYDLLQEVYAAILAAGNVQNNKEYMLRILELMNKRGPYGQVDASEKLYLFLLINWLWFMITSQQVIETQSLQVRQLGAHMYQLFDRNWIRDVLCRDINESNSPYGTGFTYLLRQQRRTEPLHYVVLIYNALRADVLETIRARLAYEGEIATHEQARAPSETIEEVEADVSPTGIDIGASIVRESIEKESSSRSPEAPRDTEEIEHEPRVSLLQLPSPRPTPRLQLNDVADQLPTPRYTPRVSNRVLSPPIHNRRQLDILDDQPVAVGPMRHINVLPYIEEEYNLQNNNIMSATPEGEGVIAHRRRMQRRRAQEALLQPAEQEQSRPRSRSRSTALQVPLMQGQPLSVEEMIHLAEADPDDEADRVFQQYNSPPPAGFAELGGSPSPRNSNDSSDFQDVIEQPRHVPTWSVSPDSEPRVFHRDSDPPLPYQGWGVAPPGHMPTEEQANAFASVLRAVHNREANIAQSNQQAGSELMQEAVRNAENNTRHRAALFEAQAKDAARKQTELLAQIADEERRRAGISVSSSPPYSAPQWINIQSPRFMRDADSLPRQLLYSESNRRNMDNIDEDEPRVEEPDNIPQQQPDNVQPIVLQPAGPAAADEVAEQVVREANIDIPATPFRHMRGAAPDGTPYSGAGSGERFGPNQYPRGFGRQPGDGMFGSNPDNFQSAGGGPLGGVGGDMPPPPPPNMPRRDTSPDPDPGFPGEGSANRGNRGGSGGSWFNRSQSPNGPSNGINYMIKNPPYVIAETGTTQASQDAQTYGYAFYQLFQLASALGRANPARAIAGVRVFAENFSAARGAGASALLSVTGGYNVKRELIKLYVFCGLATQDRTEMLGLVDLALATDQTNAVPVQNVGLLAAAFIMRTQSTPNGLSFIDQDPVSGDLDHKHLQFPGMNDIYPLYNAIDVDIEVNRFLNVTFYPVVVEGFLPKTTGDISLTVSYAVVSWNPTQPEMNVLLGSLLFGNSQYMTNSGFGIPGQSNVTVDLSHAGCSQDPSARMAIECAIREMCTANRHLCIVPVMTRLTRLFLDQRDTPVGRLVRGPSMGQAIAASVAGLAPILYTGFVTDVDRAAFGMAKGRASKGVAGGATWDGVQGQLNKMGASKYQQVFPDDVLLPVDLIADKCLYSLLVGTPIMVPHTGEWLRTASALDKIKAREINTLKGRNAQSNRNNAYLVSAASIASTYMATAMSSIDVMRAITTSTNESIRGFASGHGNELWGQSRMRLKSAAIFLSTSLMESLTMAPYINNTLYFSWLSGSQQPNMEATLRQMASVFANLRNVAQYQLQNELRLYRVRNQRLRLARKNAASSVERDTLYKKQKAMKSAMKARKRSTEEVPFQHGSAAGDFNFTLHSNPSTRAPKRRRSVSIASSRSRSKSKSKSASRSRSRSKSKSKSASRSRSRTMSQRSGRSSSRGRSASTASRRSGSRSSRGRSSSVGSRASSRRSSVSSNRSKSSRASSSRKKRSTSKKHKKSSKSKKHRSSKKKMSTSVKKRSTSSVSKKKTSAKKGSKKSGSDKKKPAAKKGKAFTFKSKLPKAGKKDVKAYKKRATKKIAKNLKKTKAVRKSLSALNRAQDINQAAADAVLGRRRSRNSETQTSAPVETTRSSTARDASVGPDN